MIDRSSLLPLDNSLATSGLSVPSGITPLLPRNKVQEGQLSRLYSKFASFVVTRRNGWMFFFPAASRRRSKTANTGNRSTTRRWLSKVTERSQDSVTRYVQINTVKLMCRVWRIWKVYCTFTSLGEGSCVRLSNRWKSCIKMDSIILNCSQIDKSSTETSSTLQNHSYNSSKNSKSSPQTPKSLYPTPPTQAPLDVTNVLTFCSTKCNISPLSPWMPI